MMRTDDLTIRKLRTHEVRDVYRKYLRNDFPRDERRPLRQIMRMRRSRQYECCGVFCEGRLVCYAFFIMPVLQGMRCCMLDYFAVLPQLRGSRIGSWVISQLETCIRHMDLILVEVEDPDREKDPIKKAVQERRLSFYLRNGLRDTSVRVETFGVPYRILEVPLSQKRPEAAQEITQEEIRRAYGAFYRIPLKKGMFDRYIRFL